VSQEKADSSVLTGATWYLLEKTTRLLGAFLIGAWVARYLGPENYGYLAYALALVALLGFLGSWGIESLVVRDLVNDHFGQRRIISTYFFIRLSGALLAPILALAYLLMTHAEDRLLMIITLLCSASVILGAFDAADCWLQAKQKAKITSSIRLTGFLIGAVVKCILIISNASIVWFAIAVIVEAGIISILYFWVLWRNDLTPSFGHWSFPEFKKTLIDGKMMVLSGLTVAVYSKVDVLVVGALLSKEEVGSYAIAASMCAAWNMVGMSVAQAWAPRISKAKTYKGDAYINELRHLLLVMLGISVFGGLLLATFSELIFHILLGEAYALGGGVFQILIFGAIPIFIGIATSQIIVNERIYWISMLRTSIGMIISLILIVPATSSYGAIGAAGVVIISACINVPIILVSKTARELLFSVISPRSTYQSQ
jgi:polysaccharide transporter, PST family